MFGTNDKIRSFGFLAATAIVLLAAPVFGAPGDFYTSYEQAKVIAHLPLSGSPPTQMFLQQQGRKHYLYVQRSGQKGFTVIDVSKPKRPKVVTNVPRQDIAALGSGLAITENGYEWYKYKGLIVHDPSVRRQESGECGRRRTSTMKIKGHKTRAVFDRYHIISTDDGTNAMRSLELNGSGISERLVKKPAARFGDSPQVVQSKTSGA